ncbi:MAG: NADH-quinone oxidoreductase subunit C [Actinomycetota bacterium]|nr:NADH-quinone oxidoreductase subunit C [Actinomycetota bacterium]
MSPQAADVAVALAGSDGQASESFGMWTVHVPVRRWRETMYRARDAHGLRFFDWLSAVDELDQGFLVIAHLLDPDTLTHLLISTRAEAVEPSLDSVVEVFRGAAWHERETHEMFGIDFVGHPNLTPLLLADGFEGHPLRKDFILASRVAKVWPGAKEPGEGHGTGPRRKAMRPPGVPDPDLWGPNAREPKPDGDSP